MVQSNHSAQDTQPTFNDLVESYKQSLAYIGLSLGSKQEYKKPIERLLEMGSGLVIENRMQIAVALSRSRSHVDFWFKAIVAAKTSDYQKGRLVLFLKLLYRSHNLGQLVESLKLPMDMRPTRGEAHPLTKEQVIQVQYVEDPRWKTYAVYVAFCFYSGMRPSEVRALKWTDIGEKFITVLGSKDRQKGVPSRLIPIIPDLRWCLEHCKTLDSNWVFVSLKRRPLNKDVVCQKVNDIFTELGINAVLYDTRRGIATELVRKGESLLNVANLLGHKSTRTTEKYVRLSMEEKALTYKGV